MNSMYNPVFLSLLYVTIRNKYYSNYTGSVNSNEFRDLGLCLEKEKVDPQKYFDFIFGMCEYQKPLKPKSLMNPRLILEFKEKVR